MNSFIYSSNYLVSTYCEQALGIRQWIKQSPCHSMERETENKLNVWNIQYSRRSREGEGWQRGGDSLGAGAGHFRECPTSLFISFWPTHLLPFALHHQCHPPEICSLLAPSLPCGAIPGLDFVAKNMLCLVIGLPMNTFYFSAKKNMLGHFSCPHLCIL